MAVRTQALVQTLLERHGRTLAQELEIPLPSPDSSDVQSEPEDQDQDQDQDSIDPLFQLLSATILLCAHVPWEIATDGFRRLRELGWTHAAAATAFSRDDISRGLAEAGFPHQTQAETDKVAGILHALTLSLQEKFPGGLTELRRTAQEDPREERRVLKDLGGLSEVCIDIFFREIQGHWPEFYPFADERARRSAANLGFPKSPHTLARLVDKADFPRFIAALVRAERAQDHQQIRNQAEKS